MKPLEALQATLAAEHAAVYVYAVLGGRLASSSNPTTATRFVDAYEVHRARRDRLRDLLGARGATPVAPEPAYDVDARDRSAAHLVSVARTTERRCAAVYAQLVGSSVGADRRWAADALTDAAVRGLAFGDRPSPYPGVPQLG